MKKQLATTAVLTALVLGMTFSGAAQQTLEQENNITDSDKDNTTNQNSQIDVTVTSTTSIDIRPTSLSFPSMDVGTQETIADGPQDENEFGSISLENIGSEYIDRVWVGSTDTTDDPFATGLPGEYNAGNFLQVKPANSTSKSSIGGNTSAYHYVNRHEFANSWDDNQSDIPSYIEADPTQVLPSTDAQDTYVGRLRAGDEWYFYTIVTGSTNDQCDGNGNAVLRVGNTPHTSSQFGTVDFTATENGGTGDYSEYTIQTTSGAYGLTASTVRLDLNGGDKYREYDILTACSDSNGLGSVSETDPHTIRTRYNVQAGGIEDLTASADGDAGDNAGTTTQFLLDAGSSSNMLFPGESMTVDTAVEVPQGVPEGGVSQGDLTFYVTSDYDAQK